MNMYPETLFKLYICNAPIIFTGIFSLIKGWLDDRTKKKIFVLGSNSYKTLSEFIDEDQIPSYCGGKNTNRPFDNVGPWLEY